MIGRFKFASNLSQTNHTESLEANKTKQNENVIKAMKISWSKQKNQMFWISKCKRLQRITDKKWIFSKKFNFIDRFVANILNVPKTILAPLTSIKTT